MTATHDEIAAILTTWAKAEADGDAATLDQLLTDDFVAIGPYGFTLTRAQWLARFAPDKLAYETVELTEVTQRVYGGMAVVTARQNTVGTHQGNPVPEAIRISLVLVDSAGGWRIAHNHMSFIAGTPGAPGAPGPRGKA